MARSLGNKIKTNKEAFNALEDYWATVRIGYLREIPMPVKKEIERIYREEVDPGFLPNYFCSACFFAACERLIKYFKL